MKRLKSSPANSGIAWPGSKMNGMLAALNCSACCSMPSRLSGAITPIDIPSFAGTLMRCEWFMAPGWNAVIWLESRSVVMNAWAQCSSGIVTRYFSDMPTFCIHSRYGWKSRPMPPIGITDVAQQLQVVGDVARAAAELAPHLRHQEGDVQHVQLVGQDVRAETVREHHDGVVRDRSTDECALVFARHANGLRVRNGAQRYANQPRLRSAGLGARHASSPAMDHIHPLSLLIHKRVSWACLRYGFGGGRDCDSSEPGGRQPFGGLFDGLFGCRARALRAWEAPRHRGASPSGRARRM